MGLGMALVVQALWLPWVSGFISIRLFLLANDVDFALRIVANAAPEDQSVGIACLYLFRSLGSGIGVSLSATVIQASLRKYLGNELQGVDDAEEIVRKVRESLDYLDRIPSAAIREAVRRCYGWAVTDSFWVLAVFVGGAIVGAVMVKEKKLSWYGMCPFLIPFFLLSGWFQRLTWL